MSYFINSLTSDSYVTFDTDVSYLNLKNMINNIDLEKLNINNKNADTAKNKDNNMFKIKKIIFNNPATIIFWEDGSKTVVKACDNDEFNPYYGFCCAVAKKVLGNNSNLKKTIIKYSSYDNFKI